MAAWLLAGVSPAQEQSLELSLSQGQTMLATQLAGAAGGGLEATVAGQRRTFARADLLAVHGVAVQPVDLAAAWLPAGEVVRGTLSGGDAAGDTLVMLSPVLGSVELAVDRLAAFVPAGNGGLSPAALRLPEGVDEAIFVPAKIGFDLLAGSLHRFSPQGLRFAQSGSERARLYRPENFVALRIGDPQPRPVPAEATVVTRTGDRLGVTVENFSTTGVSCRLDNGSTVVVRYADLACLVFHRVGTFLSDLPTSDAIEAGFDGPVVHPFRRDSNVLGGALVANDRTHAKGLGAHSRSRLAFVVPEDAATFWTRVALDDSAAALPLRANVSVRVLLAGKVVFEHVGLESGEAPLSTGLLPVRPGDVLTLEVDFGKGRDLGDRVDWLSPVFLPAPLR